MSNNEKINELLANKEFFKKIISMKTAEEVQSAFQEHGAEVSIEEVKEIGSMINEGIEKISEGKLENVSGGGPAEFLVGVNLALKTWDVVVSISRVPWGLLL